MLIAVDGTPLVLGPPRGVARGLVELLRAWAREPEPTLRGAEVILLLPGPLPTPLPPLEQGAGSIRLELAARPARSARAFRRRLPRVLRDLRADVLLSPWAAFPRTPLPVVALVHELPFVRWGPIEGRLRTGRHRAWVRRAARDAAAIVVPSTATRRDLLAVCPEAAPRVRTISHGFDPAPWRRAAEALGGASETGPRLVVAVGTGPRGFGPRKKGLDVLSEAVSRLARPGLEAVVAGDAPLPRGPLSPRRGLRDDGLARLGAGATLLVHPARSEGFGFPPLEAMAAGVPVVTSDGGSLPEVVGDAAWTVPAGDAGALATALARVLDDPALRARLRAAGAARADAFPPAKTARRYAEVLVEAGERR